MRCWGWERIRLSELWLQERRREPDGYLFLPAACLAATVAFFEAAALLALVCFWEDFFCVAFGDLSPITLFGLLRINSSVACSFLRRPSHHAEKNPDCKWRSSRAQQFSF